MMSQIGDKVQNQRRGLVVDDALKVAGTDDVWACGDCTATWVGFEYHWLSSSIVIIKLHAYAFYRWCSNYAPTAQVASQQGKYLARVFNQLAKKEELELALEEARHASNSQPIDMEWVLYFYSHSR